MAEEALAPVIIYDGSNRSDVLTYTATTGITKRRSYHFSVLAINNVGNSPLSTPAMTSLAAVKPSTPLNF